MQLGATAVSRQSKLLDGFLIQLCHFPCKMYGEPWRKNVPFQFLSTVHAKVANSNPTNYIFLRSTINTLSIEHIKSPFFQNSKNRSGMPTYNQDLHIVQQRNHVT